MQEFTRLHLRMLGWYLAIPAAGLALGAMAQCFGGAFSPLPLQILTVVNPSLCALHRIRLLRRHPAPCAARTVFAAMIPAEFLFSLLCLFLFLA